MSRKPRRETNTNHFIGLAAWISLKFSFERLDQLLLEAVVFWTLFGLKHNDRFLPCLERAWCFSPKALKRRRKGQKLPFAPSTADDVLGCDTEMIPDYRRFLELGTWRLAGGFQELKSTHLQVAKPVRSTDLNHSTTCICRYAGTLQS